MHLQAIHEPSRQNSPQRNTRHNELMHISTLKKIQLSQKSLDSLPLLI